jgi:hypothetical protein
MIPSTGIPGPLVGPVELGGCQVAVTAGQIAVSLPAYPDGAAVHFELAPR